jgi:hypothetical protein
MFVENVIKLITTYQSSYVSNLFWLYMIVAQTGEENAPMTDYV